MKLNRICPCCFTEMTTKNTTRIGKTIEGAYKILWVNCKQCKTTIILKHFDKEYGPRLFAMINDNFNRHYDEYKKEHLEKITTEARGSAYYQSMKDISKIKF